MCTSCHVSCCRLDCQRPLGEENNHPDRIVCLERVVANVRLGLSRLHKRPVGDRDRYWGRDVTRAEGHLANTLDLLRLYEDVKENGGGHWAIVRAQQIRHQAAKALLPNRHND